MISFHQLCELLTSRQRYRWFYFYKDLLPFLTEEERNSVYVVDCYDRSGLCEIWYKNRPPYRLSPEERRQKQEQEEQALEEGEKAQIKEHQELMEKQKAVMAERQKELKKKLTEAFERNDFAEAMRIKLEMNKV